jgi:ketosteroid isomerase-like protein
MVSVRDLLRRWALIGVYAIVAPGVALGQTHERPSAGPPQEVTDSVAVAAVVTAFHDALASGDTAQVARLLGHEVRVLESGGLETREEYLSHHLPGDMAFAAAVDRERGPMEVTVMGDVAWAVSGSRATGTFRERDIDSRTVELMVLAREDGAWTIRAVHWSSRQTRR